jgi:hypothetical protein
MRRVGRLSPALPGSAVTKEAPMKVTQKARWRKIIKITTLAFFTTVANVAAGAATSG